MKKLILALTICLVGCFESSDKPLLNKKFIITQVNSWNGNIYKFYCIGKNNYCQSFYFTDSCQNWKVGDTITIIKK